MNPYKIQNRSDISRRIKLVKNGGTIGFSVEPTATFIENMRDAGFCLLPIVPLPPMNNALSLINLSSFPMGTDGRISLYQNAELVYSVRYQNLDTMQSRFDFFESEFSDYAHLEFEGDDTYIFAVTGEPGQIRFVFEDDDIDYVFNNFEQMGSTSNPTLIVEQYRLSFDLKEVSMISCAGAINSAPVYVVGAEFTLRVWLNDVLIIDNPGPDSFLTQIELWNRGILIDPDRETIVNQTTDNVRLTFQTGLWSDEDVLYVTGLNVNNMDNPTVKVKIPTEDQTGQVELPQLTETYYSEVSFCLAPRAAFTCDGATNVLNLAIDSMIEPSNCVIAIQYEIDGVIYHALHSTAHDDGELIAPQLDQSVLNKLTNISNLFTYTSFHNGMSLTNNSTTQYRVNNLIVLGWSSLVANSGNPYRNNVEPMRFQFYGNPSARAADGDTSEGFNVNFCISGEVEISCENATDSIYFPGLGGYWHVELDGVLYENNDYDYVAPFIRHNFSDILDAEDDGSVGITNIDTTNHRIKLIPLNDPNELNEYIAPTNNPTFMEHENGDLTFCLAATTENSQCYRAQWSVNQTDSHTTMNAACEYAAQYMSNVLDAAWHFTGNYYNGSCIIQNGAGTTDVHVPVIIVACKLD